MRLRGFRSATAFYAVSENDVCNDIMAPISITRVLRRELSLDQITGRIPVDVDAEISWSFPAELRGASKWPAGIPAVPQQNPRPASAYAFSPIGNSAILKGTPHPPMPQYPLGFFASYCWWYCSQSREMLETPSNYALVGDN